MTTKQLPPQAYTRETLDEALAWLKDQDEHIQNLPKSANDLVSLFLREKRRGDDAPVSSKSFKENLKNLAIGLKQFEGEEAFVPEPTMSQGVKPSLPPPVVPRQNQFINPPMSPRLPESKPNSPGLSSPVLFEQLDKGSRAMILEVKHRLNMQSETEVLRMLLSLGYAQIQNKLPKTKEEMTSRPTHY